MSLNSNEQEHYDSDRALRHATALRTYNDACKVCESDTVGTKHTYYTCFRPEEMITGPVQVHLHLAKPNMEVSRSYLPMVSHSRKHHDVGKVPTDLLRRQMIMTSSAHHTVRSLTNRNATECIVLKVFVELVGAIPSRCVYMEQDYRVMYSS